MRETKPKGQTGKGYVWWTCDITRCNKRAKFQSVTTGRMICKDHYNEIALIPHRSGFVEFDGCKRLEDI